LPVNAQSPWSLLTSCCDGVAQSHAHDGEQVAADALGREGLQVEPGILGTGFAYVLNYQIITSEGATAASTVTYLLPVVTIAPGVLILGESITVYALAGIALGPGRGSAYASPDETSINEQQLSELFRPRPSPCPRPMGSTLNI
jgi:hypothetical protein